MSGRGSRPKIASDSVTSPAALPSRVVTFSSMSRALLLGRGCRSIRGTGLGRRLGHAELAWLRCVLWRRLLDGVADGDPAALVAGHRTLDQDETALDVGLHHLEIERGDAIDAHMSRHLLILEGLARILPAAGRTDRAMRNRDAVTGAQAA